MYLVEFPSSFNSKHIGCLRVFLIIFLFLNTKKVKNIFIFPPVRLNSLKPSICIHFIEPSSYVKSCKLKGEIFSNF